LGIVVVGEAVGIEFAEVFWVKVAREKKAHQGGRIDLDLEGT